MTEIVFQPVPTTTAETVAYYVSLLIKQYLNKPKASAMIAAFAAQNILSQASIQTISFSDTPTSGTYVLSYNGISSAAINWNDNAAAVQVKLRAIAGLSAVIVTGTNPLTVSFAGITPPALSLALVSNSLAPSLTLSIAETDLTLPLAVQDAYNLLGDNPAVGVQLDVLGKYMGVTRTGYGFSSTTMITLSDADYLSLIRMAIIKNSSGSSLADIQALLFQFFPGQISVVDSTLMFLTFLISSGVGSQDLIELFITQGLLPIPMAVGSAVVYGPGIEYFQFVSYEHPDLANGFPFNTYEDYQMDWPMLTYQSVVQP